MADTIIPELLRCTDEKYPPKMKRHLFRFLVAFCLLFPCAATQGQTDSSLPRPAFHWRCPSGDSLLNFHPATTAPLRFDSIPYAEDYTVVVVYKPVVDTEATVWQLVFADSMVRGLTTERILSDNTAIRYAGQTGRKPVIHTLRQSAPDLPSAPVRLSVGDGNLKVAEVLYFDSRLGNAALRRVQSTLAVRYGITLGPVDYIGGNGECLWRHRLDSALFHHRITGIGNDTVGDLRQLCSRSEMDGAVVTLSADSLPGGASLLFGDNDAPLTFLQEDGDIETLARRWRVQATGAGDAGFSLAFDTRDIPLPTDSLVLLLDGNIVLPSATTANEARFNNLWLPSDTCTFTLARGTRLWQMAKSGAKGTKGHGGNDDNTTTRSDNTHTLAQPGIPTFSVYPNPTTGHFTIEVTGARQVQATVYSLQGKVMATYNADGRERYRFEGNLPAGNAYYATVTTESGSQTMKLVVE